MACCLFLTNENLLEFLRLNFQILLTLKPSSPVHLLNFAILTGQRGNPTRKDNAAHIVSHELETLRFVSLLLPLCVSVIFHIERGLI